MSKVLLINPSYQPNYGGAEASIGNPFFSTLGQATVAATAKQQGEEKFRHTGLSPVLLMYFKMPPS